jgi:putative restriction endonuclease
MPSVNHELRAFRAWPILTRTAQSKTKDLITYGFLAEQIGIHRRVLRFVLGLIQDYCMNEKLPPLTILVVDQATRRPSSGFIAWDADNIEVGLKKVRDYPWSDIQNPFTFASKGASEEDLAHSLVEKPNKAEEVFALVKVRGIAQQIFRKALLEAYNWKCAFCDISFEEALEGAHLIKWGDASNAQRMAVSNGLLLCSTHHRLLDSGYLTLTHSFRVAYSDPKCADGTYSSTDKYISSKLHGRKMNLPTDKRLRPAKDSIAYNHRLHGWGDLP